MDDPVLFDQLDEVLAARPGRLTFRVLCNLLSIWPADAGRAEALRRAEVALRDWPESDRRACLGIDSFAEGFAVPWWSLFRSLNVVIGRRIWEPDADPGCFAFLADRAEMRTITRLEIEGDYGGETLDAATLTALGRSPHLAGLRSLKLEGLNLEDDSRAALAAAAWLPGLRELHLEVAGNVDETPERRAWLPLLRSGRLRDLERLRIHAPTPEEVALLRSGCLPSLQDLDISGIAPEALATLLDDAAFAGRLRKLGVVGGPTLEVVARCPHLASLASLELGFWQEPVASLAVLASASFRRNLRSLNLDQCPLGDEGWRLVGALDLPALEDLILSGTEGTDAGLAAIGRADWPSLRTLDLSENSFTPEGGPTLARAGWLGHLVDLQVNWCEPGLGEGIAAFAPRLGPVRRLWLYSSGAGPAAARALSPRLAAVEELGLGFCPIAPEGLQAILAGLTPGRLVELDLSGAQVGDDGAAALAGSGALAGLRSLSLGINLTGRGFALLAEAPWAESLWELSLNGNRDAGPAGARALAASTRLRNLASLDIDNCGFDAESTRELANSPVVDRLGALQINHLLPMNAAWASSTRLRPALLRSIRERIEKDATEREVMKTWQGTRGR